jgi:hypothetical protein
MLCPLWCPLNMLKCMLWPFLMLPARLELRNSPFTLLSSCVLCVCDMGCVVDEMLATREAGLKLVQRKRDGLSCVSCTRSDNVDGCCFTLDMSQKGAGEWGGDVPWISLSPHLILCISTGASSHSSCACQHARGLCEVSRPPGVGFLS